VRSALETFVACPIQTNASKGRLAHGPLYMIFLNTLLAHLHKYGIFVVVAVRLQSKRKGVAAKDLIPTDNLFGFKLIVIQNSNSMMKWPMGHYPAHSALQDRGCWNKAQRTKSS